MQTGGASSATPLTRAASEIPPRKRKFECISFISVWLGPGLRDASQLTLFLRQAGAPLDNNLVERALKMAILHRKNALFYKTQNGARVGDLFMSPIYTCQLCGANPFNYLTELQRHRRELFRSPAEWMPWNYRNMLDHGGVASCEHSTVGSSSKTL